MSDQSVLNIILAILTAGVLWVCYGSYKMSVKSKKKDHQQKFKDAEVLEILSNSAHRFWRSSYGETRELIQQRFHSVSLLDYDVHWEITKCIKKYFFSKDAVVNAASIYQRIFDQVLKYYAEKLDEIYIEEKEFRDTTKGKIQENNSMKREEIDELYLKAKSIKERKESCNRDFWNLFHALKAIEIKVWEDNDEKTYKIYLLLKPSTDF